MHVKSFQFSVTLDCLSFAFPLLVLQHNEWTTHEWTAAGPSADFSKRYKSEMFHFYHGLGDANGCFVINVVTINHQHHLNI